MFKISKIRAVFHPPRIPFLFYQKAFSSLQYFDAQNGSNQRARVVLPHPLAPAKTSSTFCGVVIFAVMSIPKQY
jgi:hypothetical protein